ncbi:MAG TPA: ribonuclease P protein component [Phycisphaerales bacterium]|nr:ribonuclease P protein component [Phycisphaerales bacterium]
MTPSTPAISAPGSKPKPPKRFVFRRRHRLIHAKQFAAVYNAKLRKSAGPITVFAGANDVGHPRLGLSIGRRVGPAVARNAVKRRIREAFRHLAPSIDDGVDLVVSARAHEVLKTEAYIAALRECIGALLRELARRAAREERRQERDGAA